MKATSSSWVLGLVMASVVCLLTIDFADAAGRGGGRGGGRMGGMGSGMSSRGPAASGSFQRPRAQRPPAQARQRDVSRENIGPRADQRDRATDRSQEDREQNRQERQDNRQENIDDRQDFREERWDDVEDYYDDRQDWYEDRWNSGAYVTVSVWGTMGCPYSPVYVNGIAYYDCNGVRYEQVMRGTQVTYIIVN